MLAVDAAPKPNARKEVELLLDPILFGCRRRTVGVKFDGQTLANPAADAKALAIALEYLLKRGPFSLRDAAGRLLEE